ncbi:ATP synthase F1 subunit gamma [Candidatus Gottesmanbacteria bacterium RIFCSPHIGHO2_02_FULL_40_13]|uniref:ATP synthase gamma chain n=1 Tax=Candidatus Gottesmanbacteria bacterium RIFCSPHIGHO2_02_FULL_40_13 TaxID=1798384 RepID=A0A1F6A5A0_9BACT|nr:MAG: ATP synthase F1 subunit gamma [Candidatus Gottesmanbacteria bacterium RIFCSPHIGHO2_02_FULL_40_13]
MANIKLIKSRIKSAKNISQMTKAMEMVAASKMKKAQEAAVLGKPYAEKIQVIVAELAKRTDPKLHQLLSHGNPAGQNLYIIITSNKGLCGGLNTNLFRYLLNYLKDADSKFSGEYVTLGRKGERFVVRDNKNLIADFSDTVPFSQAVGPLSKIFVEGFISRKYSQVYLVYNTFINAIKQDPTMKLILPIVGLKHRSEGDEKEELTEFLIEPCIDEVLDSLLPHYLENQIRAAIHEAEASEHSARMIAMKNASDAANDLIDGLSLMYNKARQEKITYEIADIVTARLGMEK